MYDEEFYNEPSEFEMQINELKESLSKSVKSDFLEEMERLRRENKSLREIKRNFEQIKRDYEKKKAECDIAIRNAEQKAKRMKAEELMEMYKTFLWRPDWAYLYGPKCDKCSDAREIEIALPSGKKVKDDCRCAKSRMKVMIPERMVRYEVENRDREIVAFYRACGEEGRRYYTLDYAISVYAKNNIVEPGTGFDVLEKKEEQRNILFSTVEECRAYCEYLNEKNGVTSDIIYECSGERYQEES